MKISKNGMPSMRFTQQEDKSETNDSPDSHVADIKFPDESNSFLAVSK